MNAQKLYTPALLSAAMELAGYPSIENAPYHGEARSQTCGSTLSLDITLNSDGRIEYIGLLARACAVGQAAAAVFARHAKGCSPDDIQRAHDRLLGWLEDEAPPPDWPDIALIEPARAYRARHGAIALPWKAAIEALSTETSTR